MSNLIASIVAFVQRPVVERAFKTFVETTAAQAAIYTTVVPSTPGVKTSAAISVGAAALSVVWNGLIAWSTNSKNAKLDQLALALDKLVDARLAAQGVADDPAPVVSPAPSPGNAQ